MLNNFIALGVIVLIVAIVFWAIRKGLVKRVAKQAEANTNAALDKLEDPVIMSKQIIRDMSKTLSNALEGQARYKAAIRKKENQISNFKEKKEEWLEKANVIKTKIKNGELDKDDQKTIDGLVTCLNNVENLKLQVEKEDAVLNGLNTKYIDFSGKVSELKDKIKQAQSDLDQLKADAELAAVNKTMGKEFANIEGINNATAQLKKLKEKVDADMALGDAYAELDDDNKSADDKVDNLIGKNSPTANTKLVDAFLKDTDKK